MNTLKLEMENCYGIQKIQQDIDSVSYTHLRAHET